jgi:hypothetical protein
VPGTKVVKRSLRKSIETTEPEKAIEELRALGDAIRKVPRGPEGFK